MTYTYGTATHSVSEVADALEKGAEHVRAGWTQNQLAEFIDGQRYVCASGALWLGSGMPIADRGHRGWVTWEGYIPPEERNRCVSLWGVACKQLEEHVGDLVTCWNDSIGQTQDRVADTMLRLAKELRNVETP